MLDPVKNQIPSDSKTIHFTAVCGTAMGALAGMLKDMGYSITGSDQDVYPPMSVFLEQKGIRVSSPFDEKNLDHEPDLVVVGNAISRTNPEAKAVLEKKLNYCSMPQAVNALASKNKKQLVIAGTHGKTTTSSLLAWVLMQAGLDPSYIIGGIMKGIESNYRIGDGEFIVIEGDEYDTAFFDKGPKFLHYKPYRAILTGVEFDHADIYRDLDHVKTSFRAFAGIMPENSIFYSGDMYPETEDVLATVSCNLSNYGFSENSAWQARDIIINPPFTDFSAFRDGKLYSRFSLNMMGYHNVYNALSVIAVAESLGIDADSISGGLKTFPGVKRRQEIRGVKNGITVMDDFAHHPSAVKETLRAVQPFFIPGRVIAVFEPRTNTSMRKVFQDIYPDVFGDADAVLIRKPSKLEKVPEAERFSSEKMVADLIERGKNAHHFDDTDSILGFLKDYAVSGDLIIVMSNGGFDNIHERLLELL
ncbi:UDP-N-acetylmuramate:L-alanyl-gamma-D-glutamyl-meso-diaminopimelate ligase [Desulforegula conservatrix]|uniref:UDP-N-acetylmuramate:L-alanyl-gamma-D-glutamyl- meso-diaminopimelate ligase n=1 Tax=Desulforegula conservatrix TaxID=153026 RepID=UPI000426F16F|nr:UDP-N-acetylmuramate:L-alanyl-gamma-D-glutamyl-meso-diaminopimelate ligase [Desulforegula conservatrix]